MSTKIDVLDKGFVEKMMCADSDLTVVNCARVSFGKESELEYWCKSCNTSGPADEMNACCVDVLDPPFENLRQQLSSNDTRLIQFLARGYTSEEWKDLITSFAQTDDHHVIEQMLNEHKRKAQHWAPFAHPIVRMRVKAPIFVVRQLFKHKIGFQESEISRRYISSTAEFYQPTVWRGRPGKNIKQGSESKCNDSEYWDDYISFTNEGTLGDYDRMLRDNVAPEQARMVLPQSTYTEWIWTGSLAAFARMYNQRSDPHAQWEAQQYAKAIGEIMEPLFPVSWKALTQ